MLASSENANCITTVYSWKDTGMSMATFPKLPAVDTWLERFSTQLFPLISYHFFLIFFFSDGQLENFINKVYLYLILKKKKKKLAKISSNVFIKKQGSLAILDSQLFLAHNLFQDLQGSIWVKMSLNTVNKKCLQAKPDCGLVICYTKIKIIWIARLPAKRCFSRSPALVKMLPTCQTE